MDTTSTSVSQHTQPQVELVEMKTEMPSYPDLISQKQQEVLEIMIESPPDTSFEPSSSAQTPKLPAGDLLGEYLRIGIPLYEASVKGDWETAKAIFTKNPELVRYGITENYETALHIAASAKRTKLVEKFVEKLVILMTPKDLLLQNRSANTAFTLAAAGGNVGIAKTLVGKNPGLGDIPGTQGLMPLKAIKPHHHPIWRSFMREVDAILKGPRDTAPQDVASTVTKYSSGVLFIAAEMGNTKFIVELIRRCPDLIWKVNDKNQSIFHVAVSHRQEAGMSAKNKRLQDISGVALQMQRELLWYKEVEVMVPPSFREKNKDGLLPHELFTKEHKDLLSASEKWMKDTASQSMVVAALIATIVFAAAFTIPGGYNQGGIPVLRRKRAFIVFVISDAISLALATTAILIFLYILTSRYAEKDFLESLPKKLMRGLAALFLSITTMMVAFSASFFVLYDKELIWVPIVISVFASIPVILYARLQYDLLADVYHSTYGSTKLFKPEKPMLYF
ncbi:ankyrin repeat-containing domain, PGG domain protein [Tanacetum coccineum]